MELKINLDTNAVAKQIVIMMAQTLHHSVTSFAHQKFGAINQQQAGGVSFPAAGPGMPYPGQGLFQQVFGAFPPAGHPYGPFGAPPPPFSPAQAQSQQQYPQPQQPTNCGDQPLRTGAHVFTPVTAKSQYHAMMDALCADPEVISKVEAVLCKHLEEFVGMKSDDKPAADEPAA